jgi:hypothetical protein
MPTIHTKDGILRQYSKERRPPDSRGMPLNSYLAVARDHGVSAEFQAESILEAEQRVVSRGRLWREDERDDMGVSDMKPTALERALSRWSFVGSEQSGEMAFAIYARPGSTRAW